MPMTTADDYGPWFTERRRIIMRVLVAGASGFVGRRLCPALIDAGHDVRAMTRHPDD